MLHCSDVTATLHKRCNELRSVKLTLKSYVMLCCSDVIVTLHLKRYCNITFTLQQRSNNNPVLVGTLHAIEHDAVTTSPNTGGNSWMCSQ